MKYACYGKAGDYIGDVVGKDEKDALARAKALNEDVATVSKDRPKKVVEKKKEAEAKK